MMRTRSIIVALAVVLIPAVAGAQKVTTDHDAKAPFATYKTYAWANGTAAQNPLNETRIRDGVNAAMAKAGLTLVTANPDVAIATFALTQERKELSATGYGPRWGGGTAQVYTYVVGSLIVDMYDAKTKQLVWRGTATDTVNDKPEKNTQKIAGALDKMFKAYPPKAK